jgi:hypothetical protein
VLQNRPTIAIRPKILNGKFAKVAVPRAQAARTFSA